MNSGGPGLGADQIAEPEYEQAYQNKIMERLNNVDDEVVRLYKLNRPTFSKKDNRRASSKDQCDI